MRIDPIGRKVKNNNIDYLAICGTLCALLFFVLLTILSFRMIYLRDHPEEIPEEEIERQRIEDYSDAGYIGEVYYDGANVSYDCYDIPFIKDEEKNVEGFPTKTNKEFIDEYGIKGANQVEEKAENYLKGIFGTNYRDVMANTDDFIRNYTGSSQLLDTMDIGSDNITDKDIIENGVSATEIANSLADMYVKNSITTDFEYRTDKSLVWYKVYSFYNRGDLTVTFHSPEHEDGELVQELYDTLGIEAYYGKPFEAIAEVGMLENNSYDIMEFTLYK